LRRGLLAGPTLEAARALIGAHLVRERDEPGRRVGRIVEVEAYVGEDDQASHARFGRTGRNAVMYGPPGIAYVYLVYGMHECLNVVTEPAGTPAAVLVRAVEPVEGVAAMRASRLAIAERRGRSADDISRMAARLEAIPQTRLAAGPGLVTAAFGISRADTGADLLDAGAPLRLETGTPPARVVATPRIGIAYAPEPWRSLAWRFIDPDSRAVSNARTPRSAS
jgi:DNA-3-methyladenine glycosylase